MEREFRTDLSPIEFVDTFEQKGRTLITQIINSKYEVLEKYEPSNRYSIYDLAFRIKEDNVEKVIIVEVKVRRIPSIKYKTDIIEQKKYESLKTIKSSLGLETKRLYYLAFTDRILEYDLDNVSITPSTFYCQKYTCDSTSNFVTKDSYELNREDAKNYYYCNYGTN